MVMIAKEETAAAAIRAMAASQAFGQRLVLNVWRGFVAETIVREALGPEWLWCSTDYSAWDFERDDGIRLEIKQSAARQTWAAQSAPPSKCIFDIRTRNGRYDASATWIEGRRRWSDIYVFAHHIVADESADHCDPAQWRFYVVPERALPLQKSISLSRIQQLSSGVSFDELAISIGHAASHAARAKVQEASR